MVSFQRQVWTNGLMLCLGFSLLLSGCSYGGQTTSAPPPVTSTQPAKTSDTPAQTPTQTQTPADDSTTQPTPVVEEHLVPYEGPVEHIFFHPLIAYPELAFDHDSMTQGYNDWFVTVSEFDKILDSLYQKNFILVDIHEMYETKTVNGQKVMVKKQMQLPAGKKPIILSADDMNYYDYMLKNGNVYKLIVDTDGTIASYSKDLQGNPVISHDNEIVPILDAFVKEHPDFSFHGEKGMINLTGYQGILGYRTNELNSPGYEQEKQQAIDVVQHMKAEGWSFASHGYGHLDANQVSYKTFVADTEQWKKEVEPLIGDTDVYVYPFGSRVPTGGDKYEYLLKAGFDVLCSVGPTTYTEFTQNSLMMDRRHIDGISLHEQRKYLLDLFDSNEVIDKGRPSEY